MLIVDRELVVPTGKRLGELVAQWYICILARVNEFVVIQAKQIDWPQRARRFRISKSSYLAWMVFIEVAYKTNDFMLDCGKCCGEVARIEPYIIFFYGST